MKENSELPEFVPPGDQNDSHTPAQDLMDNSLIDLAEPPAQKTDSTQKGQEYDLWLGIIGSVVINLLTVFVLGISGFWFLLQFVPWVVNIGMLVLAARKQRSKIVLGIFASYGLGIALALLAGILYALSCAAGTSRI